MAKIKHAEIYHAEKKNAKISRSTVYASRMVTIIVLPYQEPLLEFLPYQEPLLAFFNGAYYNYIDELIPPCDARRERVGALYSSVSGLLPVISRVCTQFLSPMTALAVV